jgi:hypothetical protein
VGEISVIPVTSQIHAETFARALGGKVTTNPSGAFAFFVGVAPNCIPLVLEAKKKGIKTAAYYIGSDSWCALQDEKYRAGIPKFDVNICVHERIRSELSTWGVESTVVWPCPRVVHKEQKITKKCVGSYQPSPVNGDTYYFAETCEIARQHPDLSFLFWGSPQYPELPKNVTDAGRLSPEEASDILSNVSCVLRLTRHDGHPVGGIEAKMRGLHVLENFPYPGFLYCEHLQAVHMLLNEQTTHEIDRTEWPEFYRQVCSPASFKEKICRILQSVS